MHFRLVPPGRRDARRPPFAAGLDVTAQRTAPAPAPRRERSTTWKVSSLASCFSPRASASTARSSRRSSWRCGRPASRPATSCGCRASSRPGCKILTRQEGVRKLSPGQITFCVMSEAATREPHRLIAASVGLAIPRGPHHLRVSVRAPQLRREGRDRRRLRRGAGGRDAGDHPRGRVRPRQELGREEGRLPAVPPDRPHAEHHADRRWRQERPVDHGRGGGRPRRPSSQPVSGLISPLTFCNTKRNRRNEHPTPSPRLATTSEPHLQPGNQPADKISESQGWDCACSWCA